MDPARSPERVEGIVTFMEQLSLRMSPSPFGQYRIRIDPWEVDYGDQTPLAPGEDDGEADVQVDHEVERDEGSWAPIHPEAIGAMPQQRVVFIDGVRRLEARLHALQGTRLIHGAFGCYAVGAVVLAPEEASFADASVIREVVLGSGAGFPADVRVRPDLTYKAASTAKSEVNAPLRYIQDAMRLAEAQLAAKHCNADTLTIVDGPLSFEPARKGAALGYVKRLHQLYVPQSLLPMLASLPAGARTPVFLIRPKSSGLTRYSWFQRLAAPARGTIELHGLVRLEASETLGLDAARTLANAAAAWLPRLAPSRARDPRSPQNLLPIGALEQQLRKMSGDPTLARRWVETFIVQESLRG